MRRFRPKGRAGLRGHVIGGGSCKNVETGLMVRRLSCTAFRGAIFLSEKGPFSQNTESVEWYTKSQPDYMTNVGNKPCPQ